MRGQSGVGRSGRSDELVGSVIGRDRYSTRAKRNGPLIGLFSFSSTVVRSFSFAAHVYPCLPLPHTPLHALCDPIPTHPQALDGYFNSVCELDLVFSLHKSLMSK